MIYSMVLTCTLAVLQTWNDELARMAQTHADKCTFRRSLDRQRQQSTFSTIGQNTAIGYANTYEGAIYRWYDEATKYCNRYSFNRVPVPWGRCEHYTQVCTHNALQIKQL